MQSFNFRKAQTLQDANTNDFRFLAGGTTLIDLMKLEVENPRAILDINALPLKEIKMDKEHLRIGALVKNSALAHHDLVQKNFPVLAQAILAGASTQLRNKATTSGNILQRTRCVYFRDITKPCNKRLPGSGCPAIAGHNRNLAILGTSSACIANNPSDMNVALQALEAKIQVQSSAGNREINFNDFYLLPGTTPEKEHDLHAGELITGITLPILPAKTKSLYLKLRDRASYEFALASAAVVVTEKNGVMERVRIAMGGIGAKPWRMFETEKILEGQKPSAELFLKAADVGLKEAVPQSQNGFKIELAKRCLVQALKTNSHA